MELKDFIKQVLSDVAFKLAKPFGDGDAVF